jgi:hypothetical protein
MRGNKHIVAAICAITLLTAAVFVWANRPKPRPNSVSSNAIHIEKVHSPFTFRETGYWLDCWFDASEGVDRCKLTDQNGNVVFEDVFLPYEGKSPIPQSALIFDFRRIGSGWVGSYEKNISVPVIYLENHQILLPRAAYNESKQAVDGWIRSGERP